MPDVRRIEPAERDRALTSVVAAFAADPLLRWVWPDEARYADRATAFFGLLLDLRRAGGEAWAADGGTAVAMWDPPGGLYSTPATSPWPELQSTFSPEERERWRTYDEALAVPPDAGPYWYLGVLATDPAHRGRGLGSAVVAPMTAAADRTDMAAYLETASERNLPFYDRLGFEPVRTVDLPDGGPRCWLLHRSARAPGGTDG